MKKGCKLNPSRITVYEDNEGESIEQMLRRMTKEGEPIEATTKMRYFERKDGVRPEFDIRTDRFEMAREALDKVNASSFAQRMNQDGYQQNEKGEWENKPITPPIGEA